ncbi:hypothetical protein CCMA1212_010169 [Trichoderma ghanense]|uniref:Uncharacterized protein n=1 Tax=Trichoderma ghanense TaxID=65468 RepID=A0ABY2GR89_9HYPO
MERLSCRLPFQLLPLAHLLRHSGNWPLAALHVHVLRYGPPSYSARTSTDWAGSILSPVIHVLNNGGSQHLAIASIVRIGHSLTKVGSVFFFFFLLVLFLRREEAVLPILPFLFHHHQRKTSAGAGPIAMRCHARTTPSQAPGTAIAVLVHGRASIVCCFKIGCLASCLVVFFFLSCPFRVVGLLSCASFQGGQISSSFLL